MLKKLIKHDMKAMSRTILPIVLITVCEIFFAGILFGIGSSHSDISVIMGATTAFGAVLLVLGALACIVLIRFFIVFRYYKNLMTDQGYLSFTLPVTTTQHLCSKTITAAVWSIIATTASCIAFVFAILIAAVLPGKLSMSEILKFFGDMLSTIGRLAKAFIELTDADTTATLILSVVVFCFNWLTSLFSFYFAITVGAFARKLRLVFGILTYLGVQLVITTLKSFALQLNFSTAIGNTLTGTLIAQTAVYAITTVVLFVATKAVIDKRMNLN